MYRNAARLILRYALVVLAFSSGRAFPASTPKARSLALEYTAMVQEVPAGTRQLDFWMPVPHDDPYQQITNLEVESGHPYQIRTDSLGNRMLHLRLDHPEGGRLQVKLRFNALRREHRQDLLHVDAGSSPAAAGEAERWLNPDRLVPRRHLLRVRKPTRKLHRLPCDLYRLRPRARDSGAFCHWISRTARPGIGSDCRLSLLGGILCPWHRVGPRRRLRGSQGSIAPRIFLWRA